MTGKTRRVIVKTVLKGDADRTVFDEAQKEIVQLMKKDSYHRFLLSSTYRHLVEHPEQLDDAAGSSMNRYDR